MSMVELMNTRFMSARFVHCRECGRAFDLAQPLDAEEWYYGHDCS